jgi:hypothetical protein
MPKLLPSIAVAAALGAGALGAPPPSASLELHLSGGTFRPAASSPAAPAWFVAPPVAVSARGSRYLVAITTIPLGPGERVALEAAGAELLDVIPVHGYRLRLAPDSEAAVRRLPFVAWLGALPSQLKLEPQLAVRASAPPGDTKIRVIVAEGEPDGRVVDALSGLDAAAGPSGKNGAWRVTATIPAERLASVLSAVASLPEVEAIEPARAFRPMNQDAVWVHQSFVGPSPQQTPIFDHGIFGCGQIVAVADTGQDDDLCYFRDTVNGPPPVLFCGFAPCPAGTPAGNRRKDILYYNWSGTPTGEEDTCPATITGTSGHGTHVSGSVAGDNAPYADCAGFTTANRNGGDGVAPGAKLVFQEMGDGLEYLNDRAGTVWNLTDVAYQNGARIHTDSWGGACYDPLGNCIPGCTAPYDSYARDADLAMWSHPDLLVVVAAGNAGSICPAPIAVGTPAIAKDPLVVGSVGHGTAASVPSYFSSPGPVEDGRLAPTIAAQGESTVSAASDANLATNNCASCALDGTSMSAPTAAGFAALVREYFAAGFYANGTRNPAQGFSPSAALVKATLIDGAVALGSGAPAPDFTSGFGRILLGATLPFSGSAFQLRVDDHREGITAGSSVAHAYDVASGTPLRATLVWTDYPAALNAANARVNELRLEVVDPAGNLWFQTRDGVTGLPKATMNPADPHDDRNVVERLVFNAPTAGRWIVRVRGQDVSWGPQPFALVVHGALSDCVAPAAPGAPTLTTPAVSQVRVTWNPVSGAATYNVYRSFGACPGGPWVPVATAVTATTFLDTGVSGGVTYSYYVASASDAAAACESPRSACGTVVPTGDCTLPPFFRGLVSAASTGQAGCTVRLTWDPGSPYCQGDLRYNVYRGTTPGFVPGPSSRIARCLIGTTYDDAVDLLSGAARYYVVRAEDASSGHGGPCRGGNEDGNAAQRSTAPDGPPVLGTWTDDAGDTGTAKFTPASPWVDSPTGGRSAPASYTAASYAGVCADLTSPVLTLADPGQGPQLTFSTKLDLDYDPTGEILGREGSVGQVEVATGPGFTTWTRVLLSPDYPSVVDFVYSQCPTTQPLQPTTYFTGTFPTYATFTGSLVNWAGGDVKLRFHLSGDYLYPGGDWWVDDVSVTKAMVPGTCTATPAGPPPIPGGGPIPGIPLRASKSGGNVLVTWDASQCPATGVNLYRGAIGNFATFTGGNCGLPPTGSATVSLPDNVWFLVAATDGSSQDGSYGRYSDGSERSYAGAGAACPAITKHVTTNGCP